MSVITLPWSMEQDRENQIKANSVHVDDNFNTLLDAVNNKLDLDGTSTPTADIPFGGHKATNLGTPTVSADAATKGYVDTALTYKANTASPVFTGNPEAPTQATTDDSTKIATTEFVVNVLKAMYPVGAIFIGTTNTCPMSAFFGTWTLVSSGKALWTGDGTNGNTTITAGLPDIKGTVSGVQTLSQSATGALAINSFTARDTGVSHSGGGLSTIGFKASGSNAIYGASTTVQPPAYVVNVWRRTA